MNGEIELIGAILKGLEPLSHDARARVVEYVTRWVRDKGGAVPPPQEKPHARPPSGLGGAAR